MSGAVKTPTGSCFGSSQKRLTYTRRRRREKNYSNCPFWFRGIHPGTIFPTVTPPTQPLIQTEAVNIITLCGIHHMAHPHTWLADRAARGRRAPKKNTKIDQNILVIKKKWMGGKTVRVTAWSRKRLKMWGGSKTAQSWIFFFLYGGLGGSPT